ncbi:hypothetical protein GCM10007989_07400 [Devosia pacifica]|uniref:Uncharacterized protein n=1 Tax=Devosia pacifica TaxID=1335967 RepID=A0A918RZC5_9HYPH|nr:hypothetical protein GCM10007989_07400 [Devosia pacifica]
MPIDLPIVTCAEEGGLYSPDRDPCAPIRIYMDGRVEDEVFKSKTGQLVREHYDAARLIEIVNAAEDNRSAGSV